MDVEKPQRSLREFQSNSLEEEEEDIMQQKREQERAVMTKLTAPCLSELEDALQVKRYLHYHTIQFSPVVPVVQSYTRKVCCYLYCYKCTAGVTMTMRNK